MKVLFIIWLLYFLCSSKMNYVYEEGLLNRIFSICIFYVIIFIKGIY